LTVSLGKMKKKVPNLLNLTNTEAIIAIENNKFAVGEIDYVYSDLPMNTVINHFPEPGELVEEYTPIDLLLSQGQDVQTFIMPNLVGRTLDSAKSNLAELGLSIGNIAFENSETVEKNRVIRQSVSSGTEISQNTSIDLLVSNGSAFQEKTFSKTLIIPLSFSTEEAQVKVVITEGASQRVLFNDSVKKSDQNLSLEIEGNSKALVEVFFDGTLAFSEEEIFE